MSETQLPADIDTLAPAPPADYVEVIIEPPPGPALTSRCSAAGG